MGSIVGLDVGTYTIKAVEVQKRGSSFHVVKAVTVPNALGMIVPSQEADREKFLQILSSLFKDHKLPTSNVHLGLPESFVSTKIVSMPSLSDQELSSAIGWQAEQYIPIPSEDLQLEYQVLYRPPKTDQQAQMRLLLIGAAKSLVTRYVNLFLDAGIDASSLETHMLALYKLALLDETLPTTMILHLGASTTDLLVVHNREVAFVHEYPNGGNVLSRAVERGLGLEPLQAEEYKRTYGLDEQQLEGKIRQAMLPVLQSFSAEIQKGMQYFTGAYQGAAVKRILVSGGSAAMPALIPTLAQTFSMEVAPFVPAHVVFEKTAQLNQSDMLSFMVAIGLAVGQ